MSDITNNLLLQETVVEMVIKICNLFIYSLDLNVILKRKTTFFLLDGCLATAYLDA